MQKIVFSSEFFNIKDTLECGQIFRFTSFNAGFLVMSEEKVAYCYEENSFTNIICEDSDRDYFYNFFDLDKDYSSIYSRVQQTNIDILVNASKMGKGIRILKQNALEMLFSFIVSQNNNIPRIKNSIEKFCALYGEKKCFLDREYFSFPTKENLKNCTEQDLKGIGLGYRAEYIYNLIKLIENGLKIEDFNSLSTIKLKEELLKIKGVGPKVADCVLLFGFNRSDTFPVDTWIEKVYKEDFLGKEKDREKQSKWFVNQFKFDAGYFQQYLFHYKRKKEEKDKN